MSHIKPRLAGVGMISRFFIDRPIFATVLSVVIMKEIVGRSLKLG